MNRKKQNLEIERQKKNRARLTLAIFAVLAVLVVGIVSWVAWDAHSRGWVMRFEGTRIATDEMRAFLWADTPEAREETVDFLLESLTLMYLAETHGVALTEEELESLAWQIALDPQAASPFITPSRMAEYVVTRVGGEVWDRLVDVYVPATNFTIDEAEFADILAEYLEENLAWYVELSVLNAVFDTEEEMEAARQQVLSGEYRFDELENFVSGEEGQELPFSPVQALLQQLELHNTDYAEEALALLPGEMLGIDLTPLFGIELHILIYAVDREEPDVEEVSENRRNHHVWVERNLVMLDLLPSLVADRSVTLNQRAINRA